MADTLKQFTAPVLLTASAVTQYTVPGATTATIRKIHVFNSSLTDIVNLTVSLGTDAAGTRIYDAKPIGPRRWLDDTGPYVIPTGTIVQAKASTASTLVFEMSGVETT